MDMENNDLSIAKDDSEVEKKTFKTVEESQILNKKSDQKDSIEILNENNSESAEKDGIEESHNDESPYKHSNSDQDLTIEKESVDKTALEKEMELENQLLNEDDCSNEKDLLGPNLLAENEFSSLEKSALEKEIELENQLLNEDDCASEDLIDQDILSSEKELLGESEFTANKNLTEEYEIEPTNIVEEAAAISKELEIVKNASVIEKEQMEDDRIEEETVICNKESEVAEKMPDICTNINFSEEPITIHKEIPEVSNDEPELVEEIPKASKKKTSEEELGDGNKEVSETPADEPDTASVSENFSDETQNIIKEVSGITMEEPEVAKKNSDLSENENSLQESRNVDEEISELPNAALKVLENSTQLNESETFCEESQISDKEKEISSNQSQGFKNVSHTSEKETDENFDKATEEDVNAVKKSKNLEDIVDKELDINKDNVDTSVAIEEHVDHLVKDADISAANTFDENDAVLVKDGTSSDEKGANNNVVINETSKGSSKTLETQKDDSEPMEVDEVIEIDEVIVLRDEQESNSEKEKNDGNDTVERTEFVQYSQDNKADESQNENQPDADPFANENSTEAMEVDSVDSFKKDNNANKSLDKEVISSDKEKYDESADKEKNDAECISNEESLSTDVLPDQDKDTCIVPDSAKKKDDNNKDDSRTKDSEGIILDENETSDKTIEKSTLTSKEKTGEAEKISENSNDSQQAATIKVANLSEGTESAGEKMVDNKNADVIDIEDDGKPEEIQEIGEKEVCKQCKETKSCTFKVKLGPDTFSVCSKTCKTNYEKENNKATDIPSEGVSSKRDKRCANCLLIVETNDERNLSWETMEFCNEECLGKFQTKYGSYCRNCNGTVQPVSLGKYCVRFGYDVRQFCCSTCLEEFKKGLKVCSYCQKDISAGTEGFLAPVGEKGQFKDFCTQDCMEKYSRMNSSEPPVPEKKTCSVCQQEKLLHCEVQLDRSPPTAICSEPCFAAYKFVNKVDPEQCSTCKKYFELPSRKGFVVFYDEEAHTFCNKTCLNVFIISNRKIVPCNWCKVKKYNFDMIKKDMKNGQVIMMCSLNCLTLYQVSVNAVTARRINCDYCKEYNQAQYHLTMSDATIRNFCSYNCVMNFQAQYTRSPITIPTSDDPVPTGQPKRTVPVPTRPIQATPTEALLQAKKTMPVISSVTSLAPITNGQAPSSLASTAQNVTPIQTIPIQATSLAQKVAQTPQAHKVQQVQQLQPAPPAQVIYKQQIITRPTSPIPVSNKMTMCRPATHTKGVSVRPIACSKTTQTDGVNQVFLPIPVPIYVPYPVHMYSMPFPIPVPVPIPIPVPVFIPTTRNSAEGIFKEIKKIQEKIPSDPFEAELLMMAEMAEIGTDKKAVENHSDSDSGSEDNRNDADIMNVENDFSEEVVDSTHNFGEDVIQMALKMAGEIDEPAEDLEDTLIPTAIQSQPHIQEHLQLENVNQNILVPPIKPPSSRGRKRGSTSKPRGGGKRGRRATIHETQALPPPQPQINNYANQMPQYTEPVEKPDANMALKFTYGVNAWRQWVVAKNAELEKQITPTRKIKLFKTDLLQLTADELNYSLCLFVKEVKKPTGAEYAPDTIYYLCLGIQQYLFINNRIDNIFTDAYYEKFTDCLNDVAKKFPLMFGVHDCIVTRVEEEHLWECKQLGAHSPHVLLNTLMYYNTKHFNLLTVDEHTQLSFSHIMKHWKRSPGAPATASKQPGSRNVLLRFYPPQSALEANSRKKKVYEQQENEQNPVRCPVKLYEFYLSKCPESVKTRNDVFYLLPERSCVPESPVWYSTMATSKENLGKMLNRIKMVKEVNVAILSN